MNGHKMDTEREDVFIPIFIPIHIKEARKVVNDLIHPKSRKFYKKNFNCSRFGKKIEMFRV